MNLLHCYVKEKDDPPIRNCSVESNSTSFKECIATLDDDTYDNFMILFSQIRYICDYYNSTYPTLNVQDIIKVAILPLCC